MTAEHNDIFLRRIEKIPPRANTRYSKYDELLTLFVQNDWKNAQVIGGHDKRPGNTRQHIQGRIHSLGLKDRVRCLVRQDKVYLTKLERVKRPYTRKQDLVIEAGVGVKKGTALEEKAV